MVSAMERKRHGVVDFDQQLMEQGQSDTLSFDSSDDTLTSLPAISKLESTDAILERTTTIVESNNEAERSMSLREGIRLYPKAITWSVLLSMTLIMEGFSTILVPNLFAMQPFRKQFGTLQPNGLYEISADWQSALVNGGLAGQIVGLFATGTLAERIGYRYTLMVGLVAMSVFTLVPFFATVALRAYLTTYVNACWVLGQLVASIVMRGMINNTTTWAYRIPFALQWIFPIPIFFAVYFAPESPWWLVRQDRFADAMKTMRRLRTQPATMSDDEFDKTLNGAMEAMIQTNEREQQMRSGTSYKDCFKGVDRRRTEITCMVWIIQTLCGSTFMGFSTYFYEQAGLGSAHAFTLSLGQFALGLIGVFISWALMAHFGRRTLYLSGQVMTFIFVLLIGILACIPHRHHFVTVRSAVVGTSSEVGNPHPTVLNWSIAALLLAFTLAYDATLGPICYALVSEIPSTRLRSKTIVLARNCYNISGIVTNIITPRMLNPTAWGWGAKAGFFWAGTSVIGILWGWWRLPEPKGRTFGELDELFERKVAARKFKTTDSTVGGALIARTEKSRA
ncbi:hypothetical protein J4E90_006930 [Alternaria incomplexa]|uniref:uncharacterized protein n=1 Tax=Alternaria incomplexa TaxID=1187928 RepID=UPI002220503D|nr:uncharacterized protein J4E90_006930 [Alternaria incomplexa]KAI4910675.1 hypothetical protein J4E90_006930 [Alternaria incomplexa]